MSMIFILKQKLSHVTQIADEVTIALLAIIIPVIPVAIAAIIIVGLDFILGAMKGIKVDYKNRKLIKAGKLKEPEMKESFLSRSIWPTVSKIIGFSTILFAASAIQLALGDYLEVPLIGATLIFIILHEGKSIDENWRELFGWGIYQGILKLFNREPLKITKGNTKIEVSITKKDEQDDKKPE